MSEIKLTQFSHGGGCGCKIAPATLAQILSSSPLPAPSADLIVGLESGDDAAVYRINSEQAIVATNDFFTPIVNDPFDFGRIAAANALSDIYAMGGKPIFALAIVGMPVDKLPLDVIQKVLDGGQSICQQAGIAIAGGHSIDTVEPIYGLAALGLVRPDNIKRNNTAQAQDVLILAKPLGVGILAAAMKKEKLSTIAYQQMVKITTQLNTVGIKIAEIEGVHAMTDVTGFGLLGHLLGFCRGSHLAAQISFEVLPIIPQALELAKQGFSSGASNRNWDSYGSEVVLPKEFPDWQKRILTDPQTSGGLLVACSVEAKEKVLQEFYTQGFSDACQIGVMAPGRPVVRL